MIGKALFLHLRWFGLFAFVAILAIGFSHLSDGNARIMATPAFYIGLMPVITVCAILAVLVPWVVFMIDPRRTEGPSLAALLRYWKAD